jgi:phosphinothricin acetyltransferase
MAASIRQASPDDALAIGTIYNHYIEHSIATFQLDTHDDAYWHSWFAQFANTGPHQCMVAVEGSAVVGFAYSLPYNQKGGYDQTVLTSIYLDTAHPGQGLGTKLYDALFKAIDGVHRIYAWIALPNEASIALHKSFGFKQAATLSEIGFKHGRYIDVLVMERDGS